MMQSQTYTDEVERKNWEEKKDDMMLGRKTSVGEKGRSINDAPGRDQKIKFVNMPQAREGRSADGVPLLWEPVGNADTTATGITPPPQYAKKKNKTNTLARDLHFRDVFLLLLLSFQTPSTMDNLF